MPLRPTIVLTGNIRVEGGDKHVIRQRKEQQNGVNTNHVFEHTRQVTKDRLDANVVSTEYMRRVRNLRVLKTPFGSLVDAEKLPQVKELIAEATRAVGAFNARVGSAATARLTNGLLWEPLRGNRLAAVEGWLARGVAEHNAEVIKAVAALAALT
jgi:hypothetical protein